MEHKMLTMDLGEIRECIIEVSVKDGGTFVIENATYTFSKGDEIVSSGDCTVIEHELYAILQPKEAGVHRLVYTYDIANERLIDKIWINVKE